MDLTVRYSGFIHVLLVRLIASFSSTSDLDFGILVQEFLRHYETGETMLGRKKERDRDMITRTILMALIKRITRLLGQYALYRHRKVC